MAAVFVEERFCGTLPRDSESLSEADFCPQQMEVTAFSCKQKPNNSKKGHDRVETVARTKLMMLLRQMCTTNTLWRECAMSSEGPRTFSWSASQLSMHISSYVSRWHLFLISALKYSCVHTSYVELCKQTVFPEMLCTHLMFYCENPLVVKFLSSLCNIPKRFVTLLVNSAKKEIKISSDNVTVGLFGLFFFFSF